MKRSIKSKILTIALGASMAISCFISGASTLNVKHVKAEDLGPNTTGVFETSYRNRFTKNLSTDNWFKGGTIEFDLLNSNFKDLKTAEYVLSDSSGTIVHLPNTGFPNSMDETLFEGYNAVSKWCTYTPASINFNFYRSTEDMGTFNWHTGDADEGGGRNQTSAFTFYANGTIIQTYGDVNNYNERKAILHKPGQDNFIGTQEDIDKFMEDGYRYKVQWVWGYVDADKNIRVEAQNAYAWYITYRKPISDPTASYETLFAIPINYPDNVQWRNGKANYSGFEITGHNTNKNQSGAGNPSVRSKNVICELDNIAIYDGYDYDTAPIKAYADFETPYSNFELTKEDSKMKFGYNESNYVAKDSSEFFTTYECDLNGIRLQTTNSVVEMSEPNGQATRSLKIKDIHKVTLMSEGNVIKIIDVVHGDKVTLPELLEEGSFIWDVDGIDLNCIESDIVIEGKKNPNGITTSMIFDTSYRTRITTQLSQAEKYLGGTIEFDLLSSDMKDENNVRGYGPNGEYVGVEGINIKEKNNYAYTSNNYASITFNFFRLSDEMGVENWRVAPDMEKQAASFTYYADGRIYEYAYGLLDYANRNQWERKPGDDHGFIGNEKDIEKFMEPGYSYKVQWLWGNINRNGEVTVNNSNEEAWYVVSSKNIGMPQEGYELLFAFRVHCPKNITEKSGNYAGFEISANTGWNRTSGYENEFSNFNKNVEMEMDNIAIYDGYKIDNANKYVCLNFEDENINLELEDADLKEAPISGYPWGANLSYQYLDIHVSESNGIKIQSVNGPIAAIESIARRNYNRRANYSVSFIEGENIVSKTCVPSGFRTGMPTYRIDGKLYKWDKDTLQTDPITKDISINVFKRNSRNVSFYSHYGDENKKVISKLPNDEVVSLGVDDFTKKHYILIGWSLYDDGVIDYNINEKFIMPDKDVDLYAVWERVIYNVQFKCDDNILQSVSVKAGDKAFYTGIVPKKDNAVFIGWDKNIDVIEENLVVNAIFESNYDREISNKTLKIKAQNYDLDNRLFMGRILEKGDNKTIILDIVNVTNKDKNKIYAALGPSLNEENFNDMMDISAIVDNYTTIKIVTTKYYISIYTKNLDQSDDEYELRIKKDIIDTLKSGFYGIIIDTPKNDLLDIEINSLEVYSDNDSYKDTMELGDLELEIDTVKSKTIKSLGGILTFYSNGNVEIEKILRSLEFEVKFIDENTNEVVGVRKCYKGGKATAPSIKGYTYNFLDIENVDENKLIKGQCTKDNYKITFKGIQLDDISFQYGESVVLPSMENSNNYIIVGWSIYENANNPMWKASENVLMNAENITLYPVWEIKKFNVIYKNYDGTVLCETFVPYKGTPTYNGTIPQKEGYVFAGWDKELKGVTENKVVTAIFEKLVEDKYTLNVYNGSGSGEYTAGEKIYISPDKLDKFKFSKWSVFEDIEISKEGNEYYIIMPSNNVSIIGLYEEVTSFNTLMRDYVFVWVTASCAFIVSIVSILIIVKKRRGKNK